MEKIKVGLCGYGPMGRMHAQMLHRMEEVDLVGIGEVQEDLRAKAAAELGVRTFESGEDLIDAGIAEVVYVVTPTYLHGPLAIRALEQGAHVFTEKPMGLDPEVCAAMIAAAERNERFLTVGQVLRFWPEYIYLRDAIADGRFGELRGLSMVRTGGASFGYQGWYLDEKRGGTQIFDRHMHDTDLVVWLFGLPKAVSVWGRETEKSGILHSYSRYIYDRDTAIFAEGSADFPRGFPFTMAYVAVFDHGAIEYSNRTKPTLKAYPEGKEPETPELPNPLGDLDVGLNITSAGPYYLEDVYFLDCVRQGRKPEVVTPESARDTVRVVRAEMRSARANAPVEIA